MIAQLMEDRGTVVALDRTQAKADQVTSLAQVCVIHVVESVLAGHDEGAWALCSHFEGHFLH